MEQTIIVDKSAEEVKNGAVLFSEFDQQKFTVIFSNFMTSKLGYAISILNDPATKEYVVGSAFHGYGGDVNAMSLVHNAHPDKGLYFTEISGGDCSTNFSDNLQ